MVQSVENGMHDDAAGVVETMSLALQRHGKMRGRLGQAGPGLQVPCAHRVADASFGRSGVPLQQ